MEPKFLISVALTLCACVLAVYLFVAIVVVQSNADPVAGTPEIMTSAPPAQQPALEHPGEKIFRSNCKSCHRVHQKLVGPALAGVLERRDSLWVIQMIRNSSKLIASGDPTAVALFREYNETQMTSFNALTDEELRSLLEYLILETERAMESVPAPRVEV